MCICEKKSFCHVHAYLCIWMNLFHVLLWVKDILRKENITVVAYFVQICTKFKFYKEIKCFIANRWWKLSHKIISFALYYCIDIRVWSGKFSIFYQLCFVLLHSRATVGTRASIASPKNLFYRKLSSGVTRKFVEKFLSTLSPNYFSFFGFSIFYDLFFVFLNRGPYGKKRFTRHLWNYITVTDLLPKIHAY